MRLVAVIVIASIFLMTGVAYAADRIISPIPLDDESIITPIVLPPPDVTFSDLLEARPDTETVLSVSTASSQAAGYFGVSDILTEPLAQATPAATVSATPTATPIATRTAKKRAVTITLVGDSMIDTLGPVGGNLAAKLNTTYPNSTFTVINHGVGAENIDSGLKRLTNGYSYLGLGRNSVVSEKPDIVVIESFGYNPYPEPDINTSLTKHWLQLAAMVDTVKRELPEAKIVIAATIAPNWDLFGDGAPFLSFSPEGKRTKVTEIKKYIENAIAFAKSQNLPLANAYNPTLMGDGNGRPEYINGGDHIHYSDSGRNLMASKIAEAITVNRLLE